MTDEKHIASVKRPLLCSYEADSNKSAANLNKRIRVPVLPVVPHTVIVEHKPHKQHNPNKVVVPHKVFDIHPLLTNILSHTFTVRTYATYRLVSKRWNQHVQTNHLWWPVFKQLWFTYDQHTRSAMVDETIQDDMWYRGHYTTEDEKSARSVAENRFQSSTHMRDVIITRKPHLFAPPRPGGSWQEQYRARVSDRIPRLVYVDCSDGHAFLPTAGWFQYLTNAGGYPEYGQMSERYMGAEFWVRQMVGNLRHHDDGFGNDMDQLHRYKVRGIRQTHIASEFLEFYRRIQHKHNFCVHWSDLSDEDVFPLKKKDDLEYGGLTPVQPLNDILYDHAKNNEWQAPRITRHDGSSGWVCTDRCAALVARAACASVADAPTTPTQYFLLTSNTSQTQPQFLFASTTMNWCFDMEQAMRTNAGYNGIFNVRKQKDRTPAIIFGDGSPENDGHHQPWSVGACGLTPSGLEEFYEQWNTSTSPRQTGCDQTGCGECLGPGMIKYFCDSMMSCYQCWTRWTNRTNES